MQLSLMDLKLLKIGYMKKFIKKVGFILSIPLVWLLVIYNIPTFLLDYIINWLRSTSNMANIIRYWKLLKFGVISLYNNKDVTLEEYTKKINLILEDKNNPRVFILGEVKELWLFLSKDDIDINFYDDIQY